MSRSITKKLAAVIAVLLFLVSARIFAAEAAVACASPITTLPMPDGQPPVCAAARVPMIMYHSVSRGTPGKYVIPPETLEEDIIYLKNAGYKTVFVSDLIDFAQGKGALPEKAIALTFDDGHYNFLSEVVPVLREREAKATVSIVGAFTDKETGKERRSSYFSYLNADELTEVALCGCAEIGNHSYALHSGVGAKPLWGESYERYKARFTRDTDKCDALIRACGGKAAVYTCPFGRYDGFTARAVREYGYGAMLTCEEGINELAPGDTAALYKLKRFNRPYGESSEAYFKNRGII